MTQLAAGPVHTVARASFDWQCFAADRPMYGGVHDWHMLEGPCVVKANGRYWCLYSGGCWQDRSYGVDFVSADTLLGPWHDEGTASGPRVLRTVPGHVIGPGHCSVVSRIGDAESHVMAYHAWGPGFVARRMCIDPLHMSANGPKASGPSWTPQLR